MTDKYVDFYINYNPEFSNVEKIKNTVFCTSRFLAFPDFNFALTVSGKPDIKQIETYFKNLNKKPTIYEIDEQFADCKDVLKNYKPAWKDSWLAYEDIGKLKKKFKFFKDSTDITLEALSESNFKDWDKTNKKGFGQDSPYEVVDLGVNGGYCGMVWDSYTKRLRGNVFVYLIKFKEQFAGAVTLSVKDDICFMCGFTILPEYRKTKVLLVLIKILDLLLKKKVKTIFCNTAEGGYPEKLYKHMGLTKIHSVNIYKKEENAGADK